jgi:hypothetical protein
MDAALAALIGAFGGAGVGFIGSAKISADQRREARRVEKVQAFSSYLGALYPAVAELRELPADSGSWRTLASDAIDRLQGEAATYMRNRKILASLGNQHIWRMDRLSAAVARVQVLDMPPELIGVFNEANDYVARLGEERTDDVKAEWPDLYKRLHAAASLLDSGGGARTMPSG